MVKTIAYELAVIRKWLIRDPGDMDEEALRELDAVLDGLGERLAKLDSLPARKSWADLRPQY